MCHDPSAKDVLLALAIAQVATTIVAATCSVPNDSQQREWRLERPDVAGVSTLDPYVSLPMTCIWRSGDLGISRSGAVEPAASEWVVAAGAAWSVNLFESTANHRYAVQLVSWGRELTRPLGPGVLRGRFAWAAEATPIFAQTAPSRLYGFGLAPIVWRWNFGPRPRWSAFGELSMGGLWTSGPIPTKTSRANFTAHWGGGVRLRTSGRHAVLLGYRFQHISNGNNLGSNPGVNSHVLLAGLSLTRPH